CTYSAVIAAELAKGRSIYESVATAKVFITDAIHYSLKLGKGNGPTNHWGYRLQDVPKVKEEALMDYLSAIRKQKPMIHNITNIVVANFSANGLLALGASPAMANAPEEVEEMVSHADALVLNIGTYTQTQVEAMLLAGKDENDQGIPVILDPVAVGTTNFQKNTVQQILTEIDVAVIRGNTGEIAYLGELSVEMKGADALLDEIAPDIAIETAKKH